MMNLTANLHSHGWHRHLLLIAIAAIFFGSRQRIHAADNQMFSVKDAIEMTTFSDPYTRSADATCKVSPDGRYFFVITTRGVLASNRLESTIWRYRTPRVISFLRDETHAQPRPLMLLQITAVPKAEQLDSYGSLITKAQWASSSAAILFLGETGDGIRRLYSVDIRDGKRTLVSPTAGDITDFTEAAGTIAFISRNRRSASASSALSEPSKDVSAVLTGHTILNIFDPAHFSSDGMVDMESDLWETHAKRMRHISKTRSAETWHYPSSASNFFHLSLAPDGKALIAARPVSSIPSSWHHFRTLLADFDFGKLPTSEENAAEDWNWPWEYVFIDLSNDAIFPLIAAPAAWRAGYGEPFTASWSPDGSRVLVTSTFFPPGDDTATSKEQTPPCSVAVFTVATRSVQCVARTRYPDSKDRLRSARFGASSQKVLLQWSTAKEQRQETYQDESDHWILKSSSASSLKTNATLKVSIHQALNESPTLWAQDPLTGRNKQLWNPNPQLSSLHMGQTSVYSWTDESGYQWKAGLVKPYGYVPGYRYPLVVQTHGFNQQEFLTDGSYTTGFAAQALAASGIMVLQMEDRSDRHFTSVSQEALLFADGCASAIRKLTNEGLIDPSKVGIIGFSRTSWYVETALVKYPQLFNAATLIDGIDQGYMNYLLFCPAQIACANDEEAANGGPPWGEHLKEWLKSSPSFNLDKITTPLRIEAIRWYSILQEWGIYSPLAQQGKPVDLIYIPEGQHVLQQPQQRYASQQGNVDWFRFWLQGMKNHSDLSSTEYIRWEPFRKEVFTSKKGPPETPIR